MTSSPTATARRDTNATESHRVHGETKPAYKTTEFVVYVVMDHGVLNRLPRGRRQRQRRQRQRR
ncbi:hypothetical protein [Micromonospora sp. AMSO1212t]|uniref:hypothetical protein n=1 Tax=Micromonospora sp. AMSO1212t TaxID=2650565 RepID=UPI001CEC7D92|nr:hypothetical protein [Micromonospora sp. AMSO1212t]